MLGLLRGRVTPWISPSRNPGGTLPLRTAVRMFWSPGILALGLTALAWWLVPSFLVYLLAIIAGWVFAIPLAAGSSRLMRISRIWNERVPDVARELLNPVNNSNNLDPIPPDGTPAWSRTSGQ
jgi:membrane glycosyltransferase